ncbi:MAG: glycosyltransferase [Ignavibacteriaceae bacterium]|nr:glycosyltransferase [Ignavibacterium sp.]MCC6254186.1 glycosyltransferase [Ignavibacteriaceae bacterium]HMN24175.1 glycosyltransferase [Ignavibacteriaceae bacterium]HRN25852.1 glycosyltransferase [Ignavibacteriaceae bacterium]HRP91447.1 glycosyltransferase [Ignavibacteriaceae bacterium]
MKKVLFISYFWPPSGKASLHLPLDIIRHLPKDEIEPIILTVEDETFTQKDESLLSKVDPNWRVIKSKALEPFDIYRKFIGKKKDEKLVASETISLENKSLAHRISIWIRMNLFVPDARVGWNFTAIKAAKKFLAKEKIDAIVSIGPPHSSHLIGLKLSKMYSIPHIPVLIDPWVDIIYYKNFKRNKLTLKLDNHFEKSVLQNAKQVVFVTKSAQEDYLNKYHFLKGKSTVFYWGYDADSFDKVELNKKIHKEKTLVHAGNIFAYQNPKKLWDQIKIENENGNKIKIKFIGTVDNEILNYIDSIGLSNSVEVAGFLSYPKMIEQIYNADMLLVCSSEPRHVPGKLFEAMRTGNPIIAFGDNNTEVKQILIDADAGMMFNYDESVAEFFKKSFIKKDDHQNIVKYDRAVISKEFAALIKSL